MKKIDLFKINKPVEKSKELIYSLCEAIESQQYSWNRQYEDVHSFVDELKEKVSFKTVYDVRHSSDEDAEIHCFYLNDKPIGLMSKHGDTRYWCMEFLSQEHGVEFRNMIDEIQQKLDEYPEFSLIEEHEEATENIYIKLHEREEGVFYNMKSPHWGNFLRSKIKETYYLEDDGQLTRCNLIEWERKYCFQNVEGKSIPVYSIPKNKQDSVIVEWLDNPEREQSAVDGTKILFKISD